jgi:predicted RNA-binding Zn-ribbon protein involved in translation (DUF1610 family)
MGLFSTSDGSRLTKTDVTRNDNGQLLCPNCEYDEWILSTKAGLNSFSRRMLCDNCGFNAKLENGIEVKTD